ncbi:fibronectin type III domain-containing protein [Nocardioides anomalus]|uniref:Fibronectin type III domain-containing protein n=1 Tax=Nocardioides anomalus TaxID=2712223 RepID=A0A6G6W987_9ACTN|nr:fibronectin type III domain-containing protein [Nocardioides anomalus]QIG41908.1 fibronectin type III domain-containing protein [Nocardioides anomalus]
MTLPRTLVIPATAAALALSALPLAAASAADDRPGSAPAPTAQRGHLHGAAAVDALGADLAATAARNGWSAGQLRRTLESDPTAWLDGSGRLYYADPAPTPGPASGPVTAPAPYPLENTFALHSKPTSTKKIFIDFDGQPVSGTAWNADFGLSAHTAPAFTIDADATTFSTAEREAIQSIWQRVSEDYAPFDVDVTTQDPGPDALARSSTADTSYGVRALVTPDTEAATKLCPSECGGVAYIDVFAELNAYYQPAWVFPQKVLNDNGDQDAKNIAEAVSHEVGHTFSLQHDGTPTASYFDGQGLWAPIMGNGYKRPLTQWSRGEYAGATQPGQDDISLIAARAGYTPDDAGGTPQTAAAFSAGPHTISNAGDQDVYFLGGCIGTVSAAASPAAVSPDLDIQLDLINSAGTVLASNNPASTLVNRDRANGLNAATSATVGLSLVYARVDGVGNGTGLTGYSDYGSIGQYALSAAAAPGTDCSYNVPSAPKKAKAKSGSKKSKKKTASVHWKKPATDGKSPVTGWVVQVWKKDKLLKTVTLKVKKKHLTFKYKRAAKVRFYVYAVNALGTSAPNVSRKVRLK